MALTVWRRLWAGPLDGKSVPFPADEPFLPVSRDSRKDDVDLYRIGGYLHDWTGELVGHYHVEIDAYDGIERAKFLPLPDSVRGLYTRYRYEDGEDGG